jgi:putative RNA 2'-phosphotransferase
MKRSYVKISKFLAYILRHHPAKYNLHLDTKGFANLNNILKVLNERFTEEHITIETLKDLIQTSNKKRYEIVDNTKIRALYGHSVDLKIQMPEIENPPNVLYHGTTDQFWNTIKKEGLKKAGRQYVHLSEDITTAKKVGKRRTVNPVILKIKVNRALEGGVTFYKSGDMFLADYIPPKYIIKIN